jgi:hypothetical protein
MAVRLGRVNVDAMLRSLTAKQFMEWEHYARLEPFNEVRADYRAASIVQMLANVNRGSKTKPYSLQDFLLTYGEPAEAPQKKKQTWAQQEAILRAVAASFAAQKRKP